MPFRVPDGVSGRWCATIPAMTQTPHPVGTAQLPDFPRFDVSGRVALVSGAARGLGRAISLALAHAGADVALGLRDPESGADLAAQIEAMGRRALRLPMDVTRLDQIRSAVDATVEGFGRLDILVNNAGIAPENPAELVREEDFDLTLAVNLKGTFFASQAAGRVMIGQGYGRIVNLGSQAGAVALPGESVYCMTKAAIAHLTRCLAVEWGRHGITVNAVAPTFVATPGTEAVLADPTFRADVVERIAALHRIGEPMEVAGAVVFLASPAASLITGETLLIDGAWTAR
jgi:NAD(P)-dependent dehydrogenase (short-subunit alcohol dehydrogenase family)